MKKRLFTTLAIVCGCFLFCLAMVADISGKWTGAIKTPNGSFPLNYTFKVDGDKLTGTVDSRQGAEPISNGKVSETELSFTLDFNGTTVTHTGKIYPDSIGLDIDFGGRKMHCTLTRVAENK